MQEQPQFSSEQFTGQPTSVPPQQSQSTAKKDFNQVLDKVAPAGHNKVKALIMAVIFLVAFLIGILSGKYFPWWISLILGVGVFAGGYIAMAQIETRNIPDRFTPPPKQTAMF